MNLNRTYEEQRTAAQRIEDADIKERVLRGLELLRQEYGENWVEQITPESLDLASVSRCVLGQVFGNYNEAIARIDGDLEAEGGAAFGFDTEGESYEDLTDAWLLVAGAENYAPWDEDQDDVVLEG